MEEKTQKIVAAGLQKV